MTAARLSGFTLIALALGWGCQPETAATTSDTSLDGATLASAAPLTLIAEKKLSAVIAHDPLSDYEASGIVAASGRLYVALDNSRALANVDTALTHGALGPGALEESQYEAVTVADDGRFYVAVETVDDADDGALHAEIVELDAATAAASEALTAFTFAHANKGFEGLAWLRANGSERLLALCENNDCADDDSALGEGRLKLLALSDGVWQTELSLALPSAVAFSNYSDLALRDNGDGTYAAAIVSRRSSALWLGTLTTSPWTLTGPSKFYTFPKTPAGETQYCSLEGVSFLGATVLAFASDKSDGGAPCDDKDQSIHLFQLPP